MPAQENDLVVYGIYEHPEGIWYRVDNSLFNATGYESSGNLAMYVLYTQLDGGKFPADTQWVRSLEDFLKHFERVA